VPAGSAVDAVLFQMAPFYGDASNVKGVNIERETDMEVDIPVDAEGKPVVSGSGTAVAGYRKGRLGQTTANVFTRLELLFRVARNNALGSLFIEAGAPQNLPFSPVLSCLAPAVSMLNHSCDPNCRQQTSWDQISGCPVVRIYAVRDIAAGEELTLAYKITRAPRTTRIQMLERMYGFVCQCPRCADPAGDDTVAFKCMNPACAHGRVSSPLPLLTAEGAPLPSVTCRDCGHAHDAASVMPNGSLYRARMAYFARPKSIADLILKDEFSDTPVHITDSTRLEKAYEQFNALFQYPKEVALQVIDRFIAVTASLPAQWYSDYLSIYLTGGHLHAMHHSVDKAREYYGKALQIDTAVHGHNHGLLKLFKAWAERPPLGKDGVQKAEAKRLEVLGDWCKAYGLPRRHMERWLTPMHGFAGVNPNGEAKLELKGSTDRIAFAQLHDFSKLVGTTMLQKPQARGQEVHEEEGK
jgi:hypothetical protein